MLIEAPDRLVEHHRGQPPRIDVAQQILAVLQMLRRDPACPGANRAK